jgi:putative proteasome-type protease
MTSGVGMLLHEGLVMVSDSRTHAGVDHVASYRKMHTWEVPGERVIVLLSAGNLAVTQSVLSLVTEGMGEEPERRSMLDVPSMFEAARLVGGAVREVHRLDAASLKEFGADFNASFILGGQIKGRRLRLFNIYAAGNFVEATGDTPFIQIGETKYGKPIIDRVIQFNTGLREGLRCALISMDSTLKSNISVGLPIDVAVYRRDQLKLAVRKRIEEGDAYFIDLRKHWGQGLRSVFQTVPDPDWAP